MPTPRCMHAQGSRMRPMSNGQNGYYSGRQLPRGEIPVVIFMHAYYAETQNILTCSLDTPVLVCKTSVCGV